MLCIPMVMHKNPSDKSMALCQMMLVKRNLRIIGDQVDQFLLIFFS
ncbi:hypothetical protein [Enterococcus faecium]|nr:hypothetical protein [Enterococcus faecium]